MISFTGLELSGRSVRTPKVAPLLLCCGRGAVLGVSPAGALVLILIVGIAKPVKAGVALEGYLFWRESQHPTKTCNAGFPGQVLVAHISNYKQSGASLLNVVVFFSIQRFLSIDFFDIQVFADLHPFASAVEYGLDAWLDRQLSIFFDNNIFESDLTGNCFGSAIVDQCNIH